MSKFKYHERSEETVKDRANRSGGDYDDFVKGQLFKPKDGENNIRILPITWDPKDGPGAKGYQWGDNWAIEVFIHRDVGPDKQTYLCPLKMKGEDCPVCDFRGETDDEELSKKAKPKTQLLAWIIDRADEKAGPQIWRVPMGVEKEIQIRSTPKGGGMLQVDHPEEGYDITFRRKGTGLNTEYVGVDIERADSPIHEKESKQDDWLEFIEDHPLPDQLIYFDGDYIERAFRAQTSKQDDASDQPTRSSRGRRGEEDRPSREEARGRRADPEPEEDRRGRRGRDPEPEAEAEEETPRRRRSSEPEEESPRRGRREPEPEPEQRSGRYRAKATEPEEEDEIPSKGKERAPAKKDADEEEEVKPGKQPSERARESLRRLKPKDK